MNWKRLRKICWMLALAAGLFNLPAYVLAHHGGDEPADTHSDSADAGLLFSVPGCQTSDAGTPTL